MKTDLGNLTAYLQSYRGSLIQSGSFLSGNYPDFEQWKIQARQHILQLLDYAPTPTALNGETIQRSETADYIREEVLFNSANGVRIQGTLLLPKHGEPPFPTIVAIHDHGAFYYFGREKIFPMENEPLILSEFKKLCYGGASYTETLVQRGYAVFGIDGYYFGTRRVDLAQVHRDMFGSDWDRFQTLTPGSDEYIAFVNTMAGRLEHLMMRTILTAGTTWAGMLYHDDRKAVDYLLTRPEIDRERIGCCGLSIGGIRSAHLAALDPRIRCAVVVGWMTTYHSLMANHLRNHTFMIYIPGLAQFMDLPDVMLLHAPNPLFVQQCTQDILFPIEGMETACSIIKEGYQRVGAASQFTYQFYDNGHEFNRSMQQDAFDWLDRNLL
jgi:dienelactone hydrolase